MKNHLLLFIAFSFLLQFCTQEEKIHWPKNGTTLSAVKYNLDIADSANILIKSNSLFTLIEPHDSLIVKRFTINYSAVTKENVEYFREADQKVTNSLNSNVTEYYNFGSTNIKDFCD